MTGEERPPITDRASVEKLFGLYFHSSRPAGGLC
jgi:hypothetical protein